MMSSGLAQLALKCASCDSRLAFEVIPSTAIALGFNGANKDVKIEEEYFKWPTFF